MYNDSEIISGFSGLVAWRQNKDASGWQLSSNLTTASSRHVINGVHPALTIDNLISVSDASNVAEFNTWLEERTQASILKAIDAWLAEKASFLTAKSLLAADTLFKSTGNITNLETSNSKIVGMEYVPYLSNNLVIDVDKISLQLSADQTLIVHLFESGQLDPVHSETFDYTGGGSVQWFDISWQMKGKGSYLIAYDQHTLVGSAINGIYNHNYCSSGVASFPASRYFTAAAFSADAGVLDTLWDLSKNSYTLETNYGLNVSASVRCDYTSFLIQQKTLFKSLLQYQIGMDMLRELATNPNSLVNRNEANLSRNQLLYAIDGNTDSRQSQSNVYSLYRKALKGVQFDEGAIDKICMTCKKRSVRYRSIGPG